MSASGVVEKAHFSQTTTSGQTSNLDSQDSTNQTLQDVTMDEYKVPFPSTSELRSLAAASGRLPGQPRISLDDPVGLSVYLRKDLLTCRLNSLAPHLWLVAKPDSSHISSLTRQGTRGRSIVITEWPEIHLAWIYNRVYIKPLPEYLLCHDFWTSYLCKDGAKSDAEHRDLVKAARGFLRSYAYLITHGSDFQIAKNLGLLPADVTFERFCDFVREFADMPDNMVSARWKFGELRLKRVNFWTKIFLGEQCHMKVRTGYDDTISRYFAPLAFVFAFFSVTLSAMQVSLAVVAIDPSQGSNSLSTTFWRFSIATLFIIALSLCVLVGDVIFFGLREVIYATRAQIKLRWSKSYCKKAEPAC